MSAITDRLPESLKPLVLNQFHLAVESHEFPYVVIRQPPAGEAPAFCAGYLADYGGTYFVSADVPLSYRRHVMRHEMFEYGVRRSHAGACRHAFHYELVHVPYGDWHDYATWRSAALEHLHQWMSSHPDSYTNDQRESVSYGIGLMKGCIDH